MFPENALRPIPTTSRTARPDGLRTLIEMGLIEMRDEVPVLTSEGDRALGWS